MFVATSYRFTIIVAVLQPAGNEKRDRLRVAVALLRPLNQQKHQPPEDLRLDV